MRSNGWRQICLVLLLVLLPTGFSRAETPVHVPEGIEMQEVFAPGFGDTLGIFQKAVGQVVLIHAQDSLGYWAATDLPLYMKDTVITPEDGLALLQFLDDSTISVAADSELIINRFIFDPEKFDRSGFLSMNTGRGRFWVKKLEGYTRSEFKVKTKTLIAGVRGSDFVIVVSPRGTQVYALDDTVLELISLADPSRVIVLRSNQSVRVNEGEPAGPIENISPEEAARLKSELPMPFDRDVLESAGIFESEKTVSPEREETKERPGEEVVGTEEGTPGAIPGREPGIGALLQISGETIILIPEEDLVPPDPPAEGAGGPPPPDFIGFATEGSQGPGGLAAMGDVQSGIVQEAAQEIITNDVILVELPGPPVTP